MKLALDNHYSPLIAQHLRASDHDVIAVAEREWERDEDEVVLTSCTAEGRALVTNNVSDFAIIDREWSAQGRVHSGLIFASDASMPRHRSSIGRHVAALAELVQQNPSDDAFRGRTHWL